MIPKILGGIPYVIIQFGPLTGLVLLKIRSCFEFQRKNEQINALRFYLYITMEKDDFFGSLLTRCIDIIENVHLCSIISICTI